MAHVAPWKKVEVDALQAIIKERPVVALVNVGGIPSPQMLAMRANMRAHGTIRSGKNNLFKLAIEGIESDRPNISALLEHMEGQTAILATDMNPFKLYKQLQAAKTMMPAKGGDIAPNDIVVEKGPTSFAPGPIVGELQQAGLPAAIEGGKVVIKKTVTVVKQGEEINAKLALGLAKLEIYPLEVGIGLQACWENGFVFGPDDLAIDEVAFGSDLARAIAQAMNLGVNAPISTGVTAPFIVTKAHRNALALALEAGYMTDATAGLLVGRASNQAFALAALLSPEALDEDLQAKLAGRAAAAAAAPAATGGDDAGADAHEEEEEEEAVSEEDAAAGLGALFG